jgi:hypothetical protein
MPALITKKEFLLRLYSAHGGTIVRLRTPAYTSSSANHRVRCTQCDHVWPAGGTLISKQPSGCPKCAREITASKLSTTLKDFELQLKAVHGDSIEYIGGYTKVGAKARFNCTMCGHNWSTKCISLTKTNPHGCPQCAVKNTSLGRIKTTAQFKQEMYKCHGTTISVLGEYVGCKEGIRVQCNECLHAWSPMPDTLVGANVHGCPQCKATYLGLLSTKSKLTYEQQLYKAHGDKIKLISDYCKQTSNLQFQCDKGHTWWTKYTHALISDDPSGCPHCSNVISKGEASLFEYIKYYMLDAEQSVRITRDPKTGGLLEWDIFIPSKNIAIEYNGVYFHSYPKKAKDYHAVKSQASLVQHSVRVIHISDIDWKTNTNVVKKTLKHILGITTERYHARKLTVVCKDKLTTSRRSFYRKNHLQGDPTNGVSFALVDGAGHIKALMTFAQIQSVRGTSRKEGSWELVRYATKGSVIGGASRLFTAFVREYDPTYILSYSQNDWFDGSIYPLLGFCLVKECGHDYRTVWDNVLRHKSYTRRLNLAKLLGSKFDINETEQQNLINNCIPILYDSGKKKWEWKRDFDQYEEALKSI